MTNEGTNKQWITQAKESEIANLSDLSWVFIKNTQSGSLNKIYKSYNPCCIDFITYVKNHQTQNNLLQAFALKNNLQSLLVAL